MDSVLAENPDSGIAANAAAVLAEFGPPSAEQLLWDRFASWSEKWRDRASQLRASFAGNGPYQDERTLEYNLAVGLARAKLGRSLPRA